MLWLRTREPVYLDLTRRWAKGTAVLFAIGAVSGTVLSFELGLLWPRFMRETGAVIGLPFGLEGFAFFAEAIFLGVYLYGWERVSPRLHVAAGALVALSGLASAVFVVTANAWMNAPRGFRLEGGHLVPTDPVAAMLNEAAFHEVLHVALSTYAALGFAVAGLHARLLLRDPSSVFHRRALAIALPVGAVAALLLPLSGHENARQVARLQPEKLAAMEGQFRTERAAPLRIGGLPDREREEVRGAIEIPGGLSFLAFGDPKAEVLGLDAFPRAARPDPLVVHVAFQVMVGLGSWLAALAAWALVRRLRGSWEGSRALLVALALSTPLGFAALEAGWVVTEVGRQPWVVFHVLRTRDAVTPLHGLGVELAAFVAIYVLLGAVVVSIMRRLVSGASAHAS